MLYICDGATLFDWLGNVFLSSYVQKGRIDRWKNLPSLSNLSILDVTIITSGQGPAFYTPRARLNLSQVCLPNATEQTKAEME